jgi:transcription elongation factor Elf1
MKKADENFVKFMLSESPEPAFAQWVKEIAQQYSKKLVCPLCGDEKVDIIVAPKVFVRCEACCTRNEISVDKINPLNYNAVTFLHEETVRAILASK